MPGGRDTVGGCIQEEDDGGRTNIPGAAEITDTVRGMQEGYGGGIVGVPQDDTAWVGERGAMDLGSLSHGRRTTNVSVGIPDQGRAVELPSGGLTRTGRNEDGDADAILQY